MSTVPARLAIASTAAVSRTSSFATLATPSCFNSASFSSSISVANTSAPSRAKAAAQARPIPTAPAVTNARLPFRRLDICFLRCCYSSFRGALFARTRNPEVLATSRFRVCAQEGASRNDGDCFLMIIPGHADGAGDVAIAGCEFEAGAGGLLADIAAIKFLPRRLVFRIRKTAHRLQIDKTLLQLRLRDQDIGIALVEVDADAV